MNDFNPHIYFICPDYPTPVGGLKIIYNHVDILNAHGFNAFIVHSKKKFRLTWFKNNTPVKDIRSIAFTTTDIVVIPEYMASFITTNRKLPSWKLKLKKRFSVNRIKYYLSQLSDMPLWKVIYNQNSYLTFHNFPFQENDYLIPYLRNDVLRTVVVSNDNQAYLQFTFPAHRFERVHYSFDKTLFQYSSNKKPQICFMPRKNSDDAVQVINILQAKNLLHHFKIVPIENKNAAEVAEIFKTSLIFMSFGSPEGSPMPPCEAMLCGCIVVGYHGWGGREYFNPDFCYPVEVGDILHFAKQMEEVTQLYQSNPAVLISKGAKAADFIENYFSKQKETQDVLTIWNSIVKEASAKTLLQSN